MASTSSGSDGDQQAPEIPGTAVPAIASHFRLQFEKAQDSWVLLYPEGMIKLNQSASEILQRCDGKRDVAAIVQDLEQTFDQSGLADDVTGFLQIAMQQNWINLQ